jgi:serine/alanine adding enzyme
MKIVSIDGGAEASRWDTFVRLSRDPTAYHQYAWKSVISKTFGHRCHYLAAIDDRGEWQGVLPLVHMRSALFGNFLVSVPFASYGGLLFKEDAAAETLLAEAERLRQSCGAAYVELRHLEKCLADMPTKQHKVTMILDLAEDVDRQWKGFTSEIRNRIRKAEKSALRPVAGGLELLDQFYSVFARNMRDLGTPVYAKKFFRNILEALPESTRIFAIFHEEKMIAAGIALWFRDTLEMPWVSSIEDYRALAPNNLLYWHAIQFSIAKGFKKFDFGRSTLNEGTYIFKNRWGARPVQLFWQYLMNQGQKMPELNPSNPRYRMAIRIWQRLPVPITRILGPQIVRNIP